MESQASAQEQLEQLDAQRDGLRAQARYPLWYWGLWATAVNWWGLIAVVPDHLRWWIGLFQWVLFGALFYAMSRRRLRVPRAPLTWPTRLEWLVVFPVVLLQFGLLYTAIHYRQPWVLTTTAVASTVFFALFVHRTQRVVFRDER